MNFLASLKEGNGEGKHLFAMCCRSPSMSVSRGDSRGEARVSQPSHGRVVDVDGIVLESMCSLQSTVELKLMTAAKEIPHSMNELKLGILFCNALDGVQRKCWRHAMHCDDEHRHTVVALHGLSVYLNYAKEPATHSWF